MVSLYNAAASARKRTIAKFPSAMHNDTWLKPGYLDVIGQWLDNLIPEHAALRSALQSPSSSRRSAAAGAFGADEEGASSTTLEDVLSS